MAAGTLVQGAIFTVMVVRANMLRDPAFEAELTRQIERSPRFFLNAPVVLDLRENTAFATAAEFEESKKTLRQHTLTLVGIQNALPAQIEAAASAGLASFAPTSAQPSSRRAAADAQAAVVAAEAAARRQPATPKLTQTAAANPSAKPANFGAKPAANLGANLAVNPGANGSAKTRVVTQLVRSGTQIYARGCDLVIAAPVSAGAEVIADGNIHIYGTLRGRALAGASGDQDARIFCSRLEAELISIAGRYLINEQLPPDRQGGPVQIALSDDQLTITRN